MKLRMALAAVAMLTVGALSNGTALADSTCARGPREAMVVHRGVNLPPPGQSAPVPLIVGFHGSSSSPGLFEQNTGLDHIADRYGLVVAYLGTQTPTASSWQLCNMSTNLAYVSTTINQLIASQNIDPARVYAAGFSAGAAMTFYVGCQLSSQVAGIAAVGGNMQPGQPCKIGRPESEVNIRGTLEGNSVNSAPAVAARWTSMNGCTSSPSNTASYYTVNSWFWTNCNDNAGVAEYLITGGTHTWPPDVGADRYLNASQAIWQFFQSRPATSASKPSQNVSSRQVRHLKQGHHKLKRWVRIALSSAENNLTVRITLSWKGHNVISKVLVLGKGSHVISLPIRQSARGARYKLTISFADGYGRKTSLTNTVGVPKPRY
jgi:polyhydroxybutyrate depolymerase